MAFIFLGCGGRSKNIIITRRNRGWDVCICCACGGGVDAFVSSLSLYIDETRPQTHTHTHTGLPTHNS